MRNNCFRLKSRERRGRGWKGKATSVGYPRTETVRDMSFSYSFSCSLEKTREHQSRRMDEVVRGEEEERDERSEVDEFKWIKSGGWEGSRITCHTHKSPSI
jgi:hypothetical protein